jgi:DNA-binding response OmpR family regulator
LLRAVWGTSYGEEGHYLHVYVSRLRRKLAAADPDGDSRDLVLAEPGVGYRVREAAPGR